MQSITYGMALNIRIDVENRYEFTDVVSENYNHVFNSPLKNGTNCPIAIKIDKEEHPMIENVHNLAFGPLNERNEIDDRVKLSHTDHAKLFSTIVFASISYLSIHKHKFIGIDGSDTRRAYMYYRCIKNNFAYLNTLFDIYGVNYYLRMLRHNEYLSDDIMIVPKRITDKDNTRHQDLYNYFIFRTKQQRQF